MQKKSMLATVLTCLVAVIVLVVAFQLLKKFILLVLAVAVVAFGVAFIARMWKKQ